MDPKKYGATQGNTDNTDARYREEGKETKTRQTGNLEIDRHQAERPTAKETSEMSLRTYMVSKDAGPPGSPGMELQSPAPEDSSPTAAEKQTGHAVAAVSPNPKKTDEQKEENGAEGRGQEGARDTEMTDASRNTGNTGSNGRGEDETMDGMSEGEK